MARARGARVEAYGIARVRGHAAPPVSLPWRFYTSRSLAWRFYTPRSLAWRFCTLRARAACNNAAAMEPACRNAAAMEPTCRSAAPPSFARRNKSRTTPAESMATLRHRYRHSIRLSVQFVATDCMANRRRSVSWRIGHLYVSKERQGPVAPTAGGPMARGRTLRRTWGAYVCHVPHASAPMSTGRQHVKAQPSHGVPAHQAHAKQAHKKGPHHEDAGPPKPAASR